MRQNKNENSSYLIDRVCHFDPAAAPAILNWTSLNVSYFLAHFKICITPCFSLQNKNLGTNFSFYINFSFKTMDGWEKMIQKSYSISKPRAYSSPFFLNRGKHVCTFYKYTDNSLKPVFEVYWVGFTGNGLN
jgi:hypothetical protein